MWIVPIGSISIRNIANRSKNSPRPWPSGGRRDRQPNSSWVQTRSSNPLTSGAPSGCTTTFGAERPAAPRLSRETQIPREVNWDPSIRLKDMDQAGIDASVIFPSHAASYCALRDVGLESALHRAHHRYVSHYCAGARGRLRWVAIATMPDIPATLTAPPASATKDSHPT